MKLKIELDSENISSARVFVDKYELKDVKCINTVYKNEDKGSRVFSTYISFYPTTDKQQLKWRNYLKDNCAHFVCIED